MIIRDEKTGKVLSKKNYVVYLLDGSTIKGTSDENGYIELKELKQGKYFIEFKD